MIEIQNMMFRSKIRLFVLIFSLTIVIGADCQVSSSSKAFFIGEQQDYYHQLTSEYGTSLLEVCENSMVKSYSVWSETMIEIEEYCLANDFDIKGVKLWINLFWESDGSLQNVVFHEKPNSILLDYDKLRTLLVDYLEVATLGPVSETKYSHYGSVSFPVFYANQKAAEK